MLITVQPNPNWQLSLAQLSPSLLFVSYTRESSENIPLFFVLCETYNPDVTGVFRPVSELILVLVIIFRHVSLLVS